MVIPEELSTVSANTQQIVDDILMLQDNQELIDFLDSQELKLMYKCQTKSFELLQLIIDLKSRIQLRQKVGKKAKKK